MAQRGRPKKNPATRKSEPVSIRLTPDLHRRLETEAAEAGRTLSQEIEGRLAESFQIGETVAEAFGSSEAYWLMRFIAEQISVLEGETGKPFLDDPFTFDQAKRCVAALLDHFRPEGQSEVPSRAATLWGKALSRRLGYRLALAAIVRLQVTEFTVIEADGATRKPLDPATGKRVLLPRLSKAAVRKMSQAMILEGPRLLKRLGEEFDRVTKGEDTK